ARSLTVALAPRQRDPRELIVQVEHLVEDDHGVVRPLGRATKNGAQAIWAKEERVIAPSSVTQRLQI
ncbi:MAG: hypothetical protein JXA67_18670, partial [Micromonosporaceae bacterium]|nr:hypothetical protein [Micromonosporaceae bacterium]